VVPVLPDIVGDADCSKVAPMPTARVDRDRGDAASRFSSVRSESIDDGVQDITPDDLDQQHHRLRRGSTRPADDGAVSSVPTVITAATADVADASGGVAAGAGGGGGGLRPVGVPRQRRRSVGSAAAAGVVAQRSGRRLSGGGDVPLYNAAVHAAVVNRVDAMEVRCRDASAVSTMPCRVMACRLLVCC
jgi:hypothetical protein